jgi:hypothetical protein
MEDLFWGHPTYNGKNIRDMSREEVLGVLITMLTTTDMNDDEFYGKIINFLNRFYSNTY